MTAHLPVPAPDVGGQLVRRTAELASQARPTLLWRLALHPDTQVWVCYCGLFVRDRSIHFRTGLDAGAAEACRARCDVQPEQMPVTLGSTERCTVLLTLDRQPRLDGQPSVDRLPSVDRQPYISGDALLCSCGGRDAADPREPNLCTACNGVFERGVDEGGADEDGVDEGGADEDGADEHGVNENAVNENGVDEVWATVSVRDRLDGRPVWSHRLADRAAPRTPASDVAAVCGDAVLIWERPFLRGRAVDDGRRLWSIVPSSRSGSFVTGRNSRSGRWAWLSSPDGGEDLLVEALTGRTLALAGLLHLTDQDLALTRVDDVLECLVLPGGAAATPAWADRVRREQLMRPLKRP